MLDGLRILMPQRGKGEHFLIFAIFFSLGEYKKHPTCGSYLLDLTLSKLDGNIRTKVVPGISDHMAVYRRYRCQFIVTMRFKGTVIFISKQIGKVLTLFSTTLIGISCLLLMTLTSMLKYLPTSLSRPLKSLFRMGRSAY